jgi:hypothetical protein
VLETIFATPHPVIIWYQFRQVFPPCLRLPAQGSGRRQRPPWATSSASWIVWRRSYGLSLLRLAMSTSNNKHSALLSSAWSRANRLTHRRPQILPSLPRHRMPPAVAAQLCLLRRIPATWDIIEPFLDAGAKKHRMMLAVSCFKRRTRSSFLNLMAPLIHSGG